MNNNLPIFNYDKMLMILENYGIKNIKKSGNYFMCSCPFHGKDDKPSFSISFINGSYRCFSCGDHGDFYKFKSKLEHTTYEEAKRTTENNFKELYYQNIIMSSLNKLKNDDDKVIQNHTEILRVKKLSDINNSNIILKYINISQSVAFKFNLGICLEKRYLGRLAIPLYDDKQTFWELRDLTKTSDKKVLYTKGTRVGDILYYNKMQDNATCFLCEGTKDVLTMNSYGFNAMCCFGVNISMKQIELMISKGIKLVYMLYDNDEAGFEATIRNYPLLKKYIDCKKIVWNNSFPKDPNECNRSQIIQLLKNNINIK